MKKTNRLLELLCAPGNDPERPGEINLRDAGCRFYSKSRHNRGASLFYAADYGGDTFLVILSPEQQEPDAWGFTGASSRSRSRNSSSRLIKVCPADQQNTAALHRLFPFTAPSVIGTSKNTFGTGDRLGTATPGHIRAFENNDFVPVLAQQSLRELDLTGRSYADVIRTASWGVFKCGFDRPWAADGDHLKHAYDVQAALRQGCTMITADLSDHIDYDAGKMSSETLTAVYGKLEAGYRDRIEAQYLEKSALPEGLELRFSRLLLAEIALTYRSAVDHAKILYEAAMEVAETLDFEISIDETEVSTSPEAHYFTAMELKEAGVHFSSLAPRFVGEFQKGIDYIGNTAEFESDFSRHAEIAAALGYKISVHSSSDKFSVYPLIARNKVGAFHLKTSGTSWLVALEAVSVIDPVFFRTLFSAAYEVFPKARSYYQITPDLTLKTDIDSSGDSSFSSIFKNSTDRQVLHVSYGELFRDKKLKDRFFSLLNNNIETYWKMLDKHIARHLSLLQD